MKASVQRYCVMPLHLGRAYETVMYSVGSGTGSGNLTLGDANLSDATVCNHTFTSGLGLFCCASPSFSCFGVPAWFPAVPAYQMGEAVSETVNAQVLQALPWRESRILPVYTEHVHLNHIDCATSHLECRSKKVTWLISLERKHIDAS